MILREEGLTGLGLRLADYREFRRARHVREENSLEEALLIDLLKIKNKQQDNGLKLKHFLIQDKGTLSLPEIDRPILSIILSLSSRADWTYSCLESILACTTLPYELILIKNKDNDEQSNILINKIRNIKALLEDQGGLAIWNRGAGLASGEFLIFLSGAARVTPGWDSAMVEGMAEAPSLLAAGVKLVHPNGPLLEAGNLLLCDGTFQRYGQGDNPYKPEFSFVRQVDFCSPACFLIQRNRFNTLGGFDPDLASPMYGAADLSLRLRQQGGRVVYYAPVTVYHQERPQREGSAPPEPALNREDRSKFLGKWGSYLTERINPADAPSRRHDLRPGKRVLFIEDRIPAPPQGCGFPRSFTIVRYLAELGYLVTVLPTQSPIPWQPFTGELERLGVETLYGRTGNWRAFFKERENGYDVVWISRHHNLPLFLPWVREFLPQAGLIFDSEALFSLRELEKIKLTSTRTRPIREFQFQERLRKEIELMKEADLVVTVSEKEKGILADAGLEKIRVWSHAVSTQASSRPFAERKDLLFVGGFTARESPNTAAVLYFAENVFPVLNQKLGVRLWIVGSNPPEVIRKLSSEQIVVTGLVKNLEPYYQQSRVFVVPHQYAGGIPLKLLEALGRGLPAVVSTVIAGQLGWFEDREVLLAADPEAFIQKITRVYTDETLWRDLQKNALTYIEKNCAPALLRDRLLDIMQTAERDNEGRKKSLHVH